MRWLFGYVFLVLVFCSIFSSIPKDTFALNDPSWISDSIVKLADKPNEGASEDSKTCGGRMSLIQVSGEDAYKEACIFGVTTSVKLARYRDETNTFSYAVAFPSDSFFSYVAGLCPGLARCVYGYANDTLIMQLTRGPYGYKHDIISNFTNYISRVSTHYVFEYEGPYNHISVEERTVPTGIVSVSSNGRWALIEIIGYGFIRVDLESLQHKRIVAYDLLPTQTHQPLESTISDNGQWAVVVGYDGGTLLYEIRENCGDVLTDSAIEYFSEGTIICDSALIKTSAIFPGFLAAHIPRFSNNGERLLLDIQMQAQSITATFTPSVANSAYSYYLAFGDSFSSGEGELSDNFYIKSTNSSTNQCHISSRSYPYLLGNFRRISTSNLACSGSRIAGVQEAYRKFLSETNSIRPSVVSLGIGGNDVDFMGKLKSCIGVGTCEWAKEGNRKSTAYEIKALFPKIVEIITELKTNFSPTSFFLVGYPDVINAQANASCSFVVSAVLDDDERRYMSESIKYLNAVLRAAASYAKIPFVDIEDTYQGERLCDQKETAMNGIRYGDDIAPIPMAPNLKLIGAESFHPTPRGHQLAALKIDAQLDSFWTLPLCNSCQYNDSQPPITGYWLENTNSSKPLLRQLADSFLHADTLINVSNVAFSFLPKMFAPNSAVQLELHSQVQSLGMISAANDGSVQGVLALPENIEGYHTVHAYGVSYSGEKLDVYQTVYINTKNESGAEETTRTINAAVSAPLTTPATLPILNANKAVDNTGATSKTAIVVQNITESKNANKSHTMGVSLYYSIIWWCGLCLGVIGLPLLFLAWQFSKRKAKSLPRHDDR